MTLFPTGTRLRGLVVRLLVYSVAAAALFLARGGVDWKGPSFRRPPPPGESRMLTIAGDALAPGLVSDIVAFYRRDNPGLEIRFLGGGSNMALEDVANGRADVAFTLRPASALEQDLIVSIRDDSLLAFPVAIGGLVLIRSPDSEIESLALSDLSRFLAGAPERRFDRLYVPDPNTGVWPAFTSLFESRVENPDSTRILFLEDSEAVIRAVAADDRAAGLVSSLVLPDPAPHVEVVPLRGEETGERVPPTGENIASGVYPLFHTLFAACLSRGGTEGARLVTHLTSARGQRQIERTAFLPARREPRGVEVTREVRGDSK